MTATCKIFEVQTQKVYNSLLNSVNYSYSTILKFIGAFYGCVEHKSTCLKIGSLKPCLTVDDFKLSCEWFGI